MNTQQPVDKFMSSMDLTSQDKLLNDMNIFINVTIPESYINIVNCVNKMDLKIISIKLYLGILISNHSLVNLFTDLEFNYLRVKYIMT